MMERSALTALRAALALALLASGVLACGERAEAPSRLEVAILPLEFPDVGVATYDMWVEYDDDDTG